MPKINEEAVIFRIKPISAGKAALIVSLNAIIFFYIDYVTGSELSFSVFYLLPITLAILLNGQRLGILFSIICSILWFSADVLATTHYFSVVIMVWNAIVRFIYFIFHIMLISALLEKVKTMRALSMQDPLTQTANWRNFDEYSRNIIKNATRERKNIALAYLDIDNFKIVNDSLGHSVGDAVLQELARVMKSAMRPSDMVARLGGDEFVILLYDVDLESTKKIIARIQQNVREGMAERRWDITLSIGAIVFSVVSSSIGPMIRRVDDLMYEVKREGKNSAKVIEQYTA